VGGIGAIPPRHDPPSLPSAWSIRYWQAWLYVLLFGGNVAAITWWLQRHDPELLQRRLAAGPKAEKDPRQKRIQKIASLAFIAIFVVSGLDHRFRWSTVSTGVVLLGDLLVVLGLWIVFLTFRENSYTSAVIETNARQPVVSTGPLRRRAPPDVWRCTRHAAGYTIGARLLVGADSFPYPAADHHLEVIG
jgi:protein-S-isoprenylcysteine O-methyltransferase Ste14